MSERRPGIPIAFAAGVLPQKLQRLPRLVEVDHECAYPAAAAVIVAQQADSLFSPGKVAEALLQSGQLLWLVLERRYQHHQMVVVRHLGPRIAIIQGFGPNQRRWLGRQPFVITRSCGYAFNRDVFFRRQAGERVFHLAGAVPHFDVLGETIGRQQVRVRAMNPAHENMGAIGRRFHVGNNGRFANGADAAGVRLHQRELRGCIVVE